MVSNTNKRPYTAESIKEELLLIKNEGWPLYKVSKWYNILWSALKDYTKKHLDDPASISQAKIAKPFVMPPSLEIQVVNYILRMQYIGFGLTVNQVRRVTYKDVEAAGINHPFNRESQMAGWYW
jgi:hypothetical protein